MRARKDRRPTNFPESSVFGEQNNVLICIGPILDSTNYSLVPPQTLDDIDPLVIAHLEEAFAKLQSKNKLIVENLHGGKPWVADHRHWNFEEAKKATKVCPVSLSNSRQLFNSDYG